MNDVELRLPPDVAYVGLARLVVTVAARAAGLPGERIEDLKIAVSEAVANAVKSHVRHGVSAPIRLTFGTSNPGFFGVSVTDAGSGFDPTPPDADAARNWAMESGLGVTLIRGMADAVDFRRDQGMVVHMRFSLAANGVDLAQP
ncbi:MAG: ATP-binding protein [Actinomycetota bacterium]|jgi:serine/threonine-protein kinase RsbW|nr:ATP-binding protein [Actinomycetota bacterium]MDQ3538837.1 ATP-binding protein [Actinomycetota bacterium]